LAHGSTIPRRLRSLAGPRPGLLLGFAALVALIVAACTYVVVDSQARSRHETEKRFKAEAKIAAELTSSLFTTTVGQAQRQAAKQFGGRTVSDQVLESVVKRSQLGYALILGSDGKLLAASPGTPDAIRTRAPQSAPDIRQALAGRSTISDVLSAGAGKLRFIEWALPFKTPFGPRVEVEAFTAGLLSGFLNGYLARIATDESGRGYVLDSKGQIVGMSGGSAKVGDRPDAPGLLDALAASRSGTYRDGGIQRYFASAPVEGSTWRVVLNEPTSRLFPAVVGSRRWLQFAVLAALALAGVASLAFLRRALVSGAKLADANRRLVGVNATLEERVAERTAAAEERATELARSNAELEEFASVTSHDLQEPLRKIRMFGDRLRSYLGDDLAEEPAADLARVQNAAQRMQRLIDDLLAFARVEARGREFEAVDLSALAEEVLTDLEARVVELNAHVDVGDLPVIEADRTQMRQLLQNIVGNALKFHREGEPPVVRIRGDLIPGHEARFSGKAAAGDRCVITVQDNGIGFDGKYSERVFVAFQRLHGRSAYDGTGIGLSIARKIAWRHGGDITVESVPDQGSTFTVTLPLSHGNGGNRLEGGAGP
jgi:signal transduction histidine kinase